MRKLLFLISLIGVAFLTSCDKEPQVEPQPEPEPSTALVGTTWGGWMEQYIDIGPSGRQEYKMVFTSTTVNFSGTYHFFGGGPEADFGFVGTYVYYPPVVTINISSPEHLEGLICTGTIEDDEMTLMSMPRLDDQVPWSRWMSFGKL